MAREGSFQADLINRIEEEIPGSVVTKNDPNYRQGFPDLTVSYKDKVAYLECKKDKDAEHQPNQEYWIEHFAEYTFAAFIYPENEEEVFCALQQALRSDR